jgi:transposase
MIIIDGEGIPLGVHLDSASPHEISLVDKTLSTIAVPRDGPGRPRTRPERLIGDKAYDSDPLRTKLKKRRIELIAPHKENRKKPPTQDGRKLRRYKRRWKVERTFAWIGQFKRLLVRWEHKIQMYRAFFLIACIIITLRRL